MKLNHILFMVFITTSNVSFAFQSFNDLTFSKQNEMLRTCVIVMEQSNYYLKDNGVKNVNFRSREKLSSYCKNGFNQFVDWQKVKNEKDLKPDLQSCNLAQIVGETLLGKKYNKQSFVAEVCALPIMACANKSGKINKTGSQIRKCVKQAKGA